LRAVAWDTNWKLRRKDDLGMNAYPLIIRLLIQ